MRKKIPKHTKQTHITLALSILTTTLLITTTTTTPQWLNDEDLSEEGLHHERSPAMRMMDKFIPIASKKHLSSTPQPLKIHADYTGLEHLKTSDPKVHDVLTKMLIPSVLKHIGRLLKVKGEQSVMIGDIIEYCRGYKIPDRYKTERISAGMVIFFTADTHEHHDYVASAGICLLQWADGRPNVSRIKLNQLYISREKKKLFDQFGTLIHEVFHTVGFSRSMFQYYLDSEGKEYGKDRVKEILKEKSEGPHPYRIITKRLVEYAREYFNCPTLDGVPVEDEGVPVGSHGSHWEKTVLGNEAMVANTVANPLVSNFTLKLLEDSGWYTPDYSFAEPFFWAKGAGCGIVNGECGLHGGTCKTKGEEGCFYDFSFQATCMNDYYQNYCKFFTGTDFDRHDCRAPDNAAINNHKNLGEYYGFGGKCFKGDLTANGERQYTMCFKAKCNSDGTKILLGVGKRAYLCTLGNDKIYPRGATGYIQCPNVKEFCQHLLGSCRVDCNLGGRCLPGGKCLCYEGFSGEYCQNYNGPELLIGKFEIHDPEGLPRLLQDEDIVYDEAVVSTYLNSDYEVDMDKPINNDPTVTNTGGTTTVSGGSTTGGTGSTSSTSSDSGSGSTAATDSGSTSTASTGTTSTGNHNGGKGTEVKPSSEPTEEDAPPAPSPSPSPSTTSDEGTTSGSGSDNTSSGSNPNNVTSDGSNCPANCNNQGHCKDGKCECLRGYWGFDCSLIDLIALFDLDGGSGWIPGVGVVLVHILVLAGFLLTP